MKIFNIWLIFGLTFVASLTTAAPQAGGRIVGGYEVDIKDVPFQVSLQYWSHFCGGTLIAKRYVLTAAHCTHGKYPSFIVRLGSRFFNRGGITVKVDQIFEHENYNHRTANYDFSILKLADYDDSLLPFKIQYAKLPSTDSIRDGTILTVSGWGTTKNGYDSLDVLRAVKVPKVNHEACKRAYYSYYVSPITDQMLCAGYAQGGKDSCQGDSGGPLFAGDVIYGVVSFGKDCANANYPGVYSRVSSVRNWIKPIIEGREEDYSFETIVT